MYVFCNDVIRIAYVEKNINIIGFIDTNYDKYDYKDTFYNSTDSFW